MLPNTGLGTAVRAALALGLHRADGVMTTMEDDQMVVKSNVWKSLLVLDSFLAASLGLPTEMTEECPKDFAGSSGAEANHSSSLNAAVQTSRLIGRVLKQVYSRSRVSTGLAQDILNDFEQEPIDVSPVFDVLNTAVCTDQGIAALQLQLLDQHAIILLTRPFFVCSLMSLLRQQDALPESHTLGPRMTALSEACLAASAHTVVLIRATHEAKLLSRRDPFVL